ncbi:MAG: patatin-like phospholipase family protein [Hyphomicrobium sp.]
MPSSPSSLSHLDMFKGLGADDLALLNARLRPITVTGGDTLVREGEHADALFVVLSGRFSVEVAAQAEPVAEISAGGAIGEIAFFTNGQRTATVRAIRDSLVVRLDRADFDDIAARVPCLWSSITATLANRLAAETRKSTALAQTQRPRPRPRTLAILPAGRRAIPKAFLDDIIAAARSRDGTLVLTSETAENALGSRDFASPDVSMALNALEAQHDLIVFIADTELSAWSEKVIRQADDILICADRGDDPLAAPVRLSALEDFAFKHHRAPSIRMALLHPRSGLAQGTRHWLAGRPIHQHHHVAIGNADDMGRLWRFITGTALGLVACGGGAYCAAHIGIYKAFTEHGIAFDYLGGTSGGAAMSAAFAMGVAADDIDARVHEMFIVGKALARYTLPRYGLLDHTHFDRHLMAEYGTLRIEDMWKPYFCVSMDVSDYSVEVHRDGPLWAAIRASAAIPGLLAPYYTDDGRMLVDGSVISNVPVDIMHRLKTGPNVVVSFNPPAGERFAVPYAELPARRAMLWQTLNPMARKMLPNAPSAASVLVRSLMANRGHFERQLGPDDWLLMPPLPRQMGALDWRRHSDLVATAYRYAHAQLTARATHKNEIATPL